MSGSPLRDYGLRILLFFVLLLCAILFSVQQDIDHGHAKDHQSSAQERAHLEVVNEVRVLDIDAEGWTAIFTAGLFLATVCLTIATYALFRVASREGRNAEEALKVAKASVEAAATSATAAQRGLEIAQAAMIADNRAWLRVTPTLGTQPLLFRPDGARLTVSISFKNAGKAPAVQIAMAAWLLALDPVTEVLYRHRARCADERRRAPKEFEFCIFPGEVFPEAVGIGNYEIIAAMPAEEVHRAIEVRDRDGRIPMYVGGCLTYFFPTDLNEPHQSSFLFSLLGPQGPINPAEPAVPVSELSLVPLANTDGTTAD